MAAGSETINRQYWSYYFIDQRDYFTVPGRLNTEKLLHYSKEYLTDTALVFAVIAKIARDPDHPFDQTDPKKWLTLLCKVHALLFHSCLFDSNYGGEGKRQTGKSAPGKISLFGTVTAVQPHLYESTDFIPRNLNSPHEYMTFYYRPQVDSIGYFTSCETAATTDQGIELQFLKFLTDYTDNLASARDDKEKLIAIATLCQRCARLHPFLDGNGRLFCMMLPYLLCLANGFPLPLFTEDPKRIVGYRVSTLVEHTFPEAFANTERLIATTPPPYRATLKSKTGTVEFDLSTVGAGLDSDKINRLAALLLESIAPARTGAFLPLPRRRSIPFEYAASCRHLDPGFQDDFITGEITQSIPVYELKGADLSRATLSRKHYSKGMFYHTTLSADQVVVLLRAGYKDFAQVKIVGDASPHDLETVDFSGVDFTDATGLGLLNWPSATKNETVVLCTTGSNNFSHCLLRVGASLSDTLTNLCEDYVTKKRRSRFSLQKHLDTSIPLELLEYIASKTKPTMLDAHAFARAQKADAAFIRLLTFCDQLYPTPPLPHSPISLPSLRHSSMACWFSAPKKAAEQSSSSLESDL